MLRTALLVPLAFLSACATIVNGSSQTVTVSTAPSGATCIVDRMGARIGAVPQTPGSLRVDKSKHDLSVTCSKPGFQTAAVTRSSSFGAMTFGNLIAGGAVGFIVDAASGASFEYPSDIRLDLAADAASRLPPLAMQQPSPDRGARYVSDPVITPVGQRTLDPATAHTATY